MVDSKELTVCMFGQLEIADCTEDERIQAGTERTRF
jgi:hypothetical protein